MTPETLTRFVLAAMLLTIGACSHAAPMAPDAPIAAPTQITYSINLPDVLLVHQLETQYPNGVQMSPIDAQVAWDYTAAYGGSNVYYGSLAPSPNAYLTGIVVAPLAVAGKETFTAAEWPQIAVGLPAETRFSWLGRFTYAAIGRQ